MGEPGAESEPSKRCTKCGEVKPLDAFARRGEGRRQSWCRACVSARDREIYRRDATRRAAVRGLSRQNKDRNRAFVRGYLSAHPCVDCGETDLAVLDFDHVRGTKDLTICELIGASFERLQAEVAKCEVRCGNCHRRKTVREHRWWIHEAVQRLRREGRLP